MKLSAAVEDTRRLLDDFGGDAASGTWSTDDSRCQTSNAALVEYLDEARHEYCERNPVQDATSTLTIATATAAGLGRVTLDSRILAVMSVALAATGEILPRASVSRLDMDRPNWRTETGTPSAWLDDEADGMIRVVPAPTANTALSMVVQRGPLTALSWNAPTTEIADIPVGHHQSLCYWAAKRAMETRDEVNSQALAATWEAKWLALVGPKPTAKQMRVRAHLMAGLPRIRGIGIAGRRHARYH